MVKRHDAYVEKKKWVNANVLIAPDHVTEVNNGMEKLKVMLRGDRDFDGAVPRSADSVELFLQGWTPEHQGFRVQHVPTDSQLDWHLMFLLVEIPQTPRGKSVLHLILTHKQAGHSYHVQLQEPYVIESDECTICCRPSNDLPYCLWGEYSVELGSVQNHVNLKMDNTMRIEIYFFDVLQLPRFYDTGIPLLLLRMFIPALGTAWECKDATPQESWVNHVTRIVHGSRAPFFGQQEGSSEAKTSNYWLKYNTISGGNSFAGTWGESGLRLTAWLDAWRNWDQHGLITTVNCYDQAAATEVALCLGVSCNQIAWEFHQVFGFIQKEAELVGWGPCNNPYFGDNRDHMIFDNPKDSRRQPFRNHAILSWSTKPITDAFIKKWNEKMDAADFREEYVKFAAGLDKEAGLDMKIIDACAGPHVGRESRQQYEAVVDAVDLPYGKHWSEYVHTSYGQKPKDWHEEHHLGRGIIKDNDSGRPVLLLPRRLVELLNEKKAEIQQLLADHSEGNDIKTGSFQAMSNAFVAAVRRLRPEWKISPIPIRPTEVHESAVREVKLKYVKDGLESGEAFVSMRVVVSKSEATAKKELIEYLAFHTLTSLDESMDMLESQAEATIVGYGTIRSVLIRNISVDITGADLWSSDSDYGMASTMMTWLALQRTTQDTSKWRDFLD